jgi:hypothetical protein
MARSKGAEGLLLYRAQAWGEAYERFREAEELFHAPTLLLYMARCQTMRGRLVESAAIYERLLAEPSPDNAPKAFIDARESARTELVSVRERLPRVTIVVLDVPWSSVHVRLNGVSVGVGEVALNPGQHTVEARADGHEPVVMSFTIKEAGGETIRLRFGPRRAVAPAPRGPVPS